MLFLIVFIINLSLFGVNSAQIPTSRIVNGELASANQFPWHVSLHVSFVNTTQKISNCGGSIISNTFILTSADCLRNAKQIKIDFGSVNFSKPILSMYSNQYYIHPNFGANNLQNNIALIRLPLNITFSNSIMPIRLPSRSQTNLAFVNQETYLCGFGYKSTNLIGMSEQLRWIKYKVISNADCQKTYGNQLVQTTNMCTIGWNHPWESGCFGDGGGSLIYNEFGSFTQIGIMSFIHSNGCDSGNPMGFTRITAYMDWISKTAGYTL